MDELFRKINNAHQVLHIFVTCKGFLKDVIDTLNCVASKCKTSRQFPSGNIAITYNEGAL